MCGEYGKLDSSRLDVLRELGNIGAGNATTALSQMINKRVDMGVPKAELIEIEKISQILGGEEALVAGILLGIEGDVEGMMMFVQEQVSARNLVNLLMGRELDEFAEFTEMDISALQEIGNIITGAYLNSLSALTGLKIIPTVPNMAIDMAGAILSVPAIEFGKVGDHALLIQTGFGGTGEEVFGYFVLIPEAKSYEKIFKSLGM